MIEIIIGGIVATLGSVVVTYWTRNRELATRWDTDRKTALIEMRLSVGQIRGNIYGFASGSIQDPEPGKTPELISRNMDKAYYDLTALAILFPELADVVDQTQQRLIAALNVAKQALQHSSNPPCGDGQSQTWFVEHSSDVRSELDQLIDVEIVGHCQRKLKLN